MTEEKNAEPAEPKKKKPKPPVEFSQEIADKISRPTGRRRIPDRNLQVARHSGQANGSALDQSGMRNLLKIIRARENCSPIFISNG